MFIASSQPTTQPAFHSSLHTKYNCVELNWIQCYNQRISHFIIDRIVFVVNCQNNTNELWFILDFVEKFVALMFSLKLLLLLLLLQQCTACCMSVCAGGNQSTTNQTSTYSLLNSCHSKPSTWAVWYHTFQSIWCHNVCGCCFLKYLKSIKHNLWRCRWWKKIPSPPLHESCSHKSFAEIH